MEINTQLEIDNYNQKHGDEKDKQIDTNRQTERDRDRKIKKIDSKIDREKVMLICRVTDG